MWIIYLDTSALLKRYAQETGTEQVRQLLEMADEVATGVITRLETASAYDAVHLASALLWQEKLNMPVTLATFDRELWLAGQKSGMEVWPTELVF